jgi:sulfite exporter TauE/SafE
VIDWPLIFVGGLLGSSHCLGMCGAFVVTLGTRQSSLTGNIFRQTLYGLGRVFTYAAAGAVAGYGGWKLASQFQTLLDMQAILCIGAGVLLIVQGLHSAGIVRGRGPVFAAKGCPSAGLFAALYGAARLRSVFLAGVINGLLPCGLVYAYLALAASSGDVLQGWMIMALFGLGTIPALVLLGSGAMVLNLTTRRHIFRVAAWCVVLTGALSLLRGVAYYGSEGLHGPSDCPMCPIGAGLGRHLCGAWPLKAARLELLADANAVYPRHRDAP